MVKILHLLLFLFLVHIGFSQNPKIKVDYFMSHGMMRAFVSGAISNTNGACSDVGGPECRVNLNFKSSTGPIFPANNCANNTNTVFYSSGAWSCDFRCEVENGSCGVWFPNGASTANYPSNPGYTDTSAYPCTDLVAIRMKGWEADGAGYPASNILCSLGGACSSNVLNYNLNDGACAGTCSTSSCFGNMQSPTSGDNNIPVNIGQSGDTLRPYLGGVWSKDYVTNLETVTCTSDGFNNYYYARWKFRWVWDTSTVTSLHAGNVKIPRPYDCANISFSILDSTEAVGANKGYTLYQWQESNDGTNWTNIVGQTSKDLNSITPNVAIATIKYYRRAARFNAAFVTPATFKDVYSNVVIITIYPRPTFTPPTLNTSTPTTTNGTPTPTTICKGELVSATFNAGTGGYVDITDEFQYSINNGTTWFPYTPGSNINTATAIGNVIIQGRRTSTCTVVATVWTQVAIWPVSSVTTTPSVATSSIPVNSKICNTIATITGTLNAGSGGTGYEYGYSINNGSSPSTIVTGAGTFSIPTIGASVKIILFARRTGAAAPCFPAPWAIIAYWDLINQPINPTLNTQTPITASICESQSVSATFNAGSQGAADAIDQYRITIDNGTTWNTYIPGSSVSALGGNTNVIIQGIRTTGTSTGCSSSWSSLAVWSIDKIPTGTPVYTNLSLCNGGTTGTALLDINSLAPISTITSWVRVVGTTATPTTSSVTPFTITNLTTVSRYVVTMTNGLCIRKDSVNIPLVIATTPTATTIAPNDYCGSCTFINNTTRFFYDDAGRIIATIFDSTANPTLGLTEVCVDIEPTQQFITDNFGVQQPYLRRRWTINPSSNAGATITLFFTATELNDLKTAAGTVGVDPYAFTTPIGNLLITKYPSGGNGIFTPPLSSGAELLIPTVSAYNGTHWKAIFRTNTFSTFYMHPRLSSYASTLPVELISFNAMINNQEKNIIIKWSTASEINTSHFTLEKSIDAVNWSAINTVIASGNSDKLQEYIYVDSELIFDDMVYYRLKIVDNDSTFSYSNIVSVDSKVSFDNRVILFPNPTNNIINLVFNSNLSNVTLIKIHDIIGKIVKVLPINTYQNNKKMEVDCRDLDKGSYYVCVYDESGLVKTIKFVKY